VCHCKYCRAYQEHLGNGDELFDEFGGSEVFQMSPASIDISQGLEHVHCIKLTGKGALRFYAKCCNTPIANTMQNLNLPFAAVSPSCVVELRETQNRHDILGPVRYRLNGSSDNFLTLPKTNTASKYGMLAHMAKMMVVMIVRGDAKRSPFRGPDGRSFLKPERVKMQYS
jgi:hypothetical protein